MLIIETVPKMAEPTDRPTNRPTGIHQRTKVDGSYTYLPARVSSDKGNTIYAHNGVFAENLVGLGFLQYISYTKPIPTHEKLFAVRKGAQMPLLTSLFLG